MVKDSGLGIKPVSNPMGFQYGLDCFGPEVESRLPDDIRSNLMDPGSKGPDIVYATGKCK